MSRAIDLTRKEAERLGIIGEKPKRRARQPRFPKRTLREEEIVAFRYRQPWGDTVIGPWITCITIPSPPRTKKGHASLVRAKSGRTMLLQSKGYYQFADDVRSIIMPRRKELGLPLTERLHINAQFFCDNDAADQKNLEQGLADALQKAKLVENDQQFESWDGSRRHVDKARPRVEITITPLSE